MKKNSVNNNQCENRVSNNNEYESDETGGDTVTQDKEARLEGFSNIIVIEMGINVEKFFIPEDKTVDQYIKFEFYCENCDAYMIGQNQLIMTRIKIIIKNIA